MFDFRAFVGWTRKQEEQRARYRTPSIPDGPPEDEVKQSGDEVDFLIRLISNAHCFFDRREQLIEIRNLLDEMAAASAHHHAVIFVPRHEKDSIGTIFDRLRYFDAHYFAGVIWEEFHHGYSHTEELDSFLKALRREHDMLLKSKSPAWHSCRFGPFPDPSRSGKDASTSADMIDEVCKTLRQLPSNVRWIVFIEFQFDVAQAADLARVGKRTEEVGEATKKIADRLLCNKKTYVARCLPPPALVRQEHVGEWREDVLARIQAWRRISGTDKTEAELRPFEDFGRNLGTLSIGDGSRLSDVLERLREHVTNECRQMGVGG